MFNWVINQTEYTLLPDGTGDRVTTVHWSANKTVEALTASSYGTCAVTPESTLGQTPYPDVTEQMCIDHLNEYQDPAAVEAVLDSQIEAQGQPQTSSGKPWVDNYPQWMVGVAYAIDDIVSHKGVSYEVIQAHTSSAEWPPNITPALFAVYVPPEAGPQPWVQPTGAQDAYALGDRVTHVGSTWTSEVDANTWEPGVYGWVADA